VIDSVAALVPKAELEGEMSDQGIGLQARLMSKALRKINGLIAKTKTAVIFINQIRERVGVIFGNPEITTGGRALRFYASLRLETRKGEGIQKDGQLIGNKIRFKVVKNKLAAQFKTVQLSLNYNQGLDLLSEVIELATLSKIFIRSGT
jgi:recombination protein RecA